MLHGPAHAENFRQQVGRYGDRFYVDNLPEDDIAEPESSPLPSVSVIKQAFPKFLNNWVASTVAEYAYDTKDAWKDLQKDEAITLLSGAHIRQRDRAAQRGTDVHQIVESLCQRRPIDVALIADNVRPYFPHLNNFVLDMKLEPEIVEGVVFNHALGYGGTFDFIGQTVMGRGLLDFKTRAKANSYDEEAAQAAAYALAEYVIVEGDNKPIRQWMPQLDFVAICVITPDGYRVHEVNLARAGELWTTLVHFWKAKNESGFYKGVMPVQSARVSPEVLIDSLRKRILGLSKAGREHLAATWPQTLPTLKQEPTPSDLITIEGLISRVETRYEEPFPETPSALPDEGATLDQPTYEAIVNRYNQLDDGLKEAVKYYYDKAEPTVRMGRVWNRTVRRFEILRALIVLSAHCDGYTDIMAEVCPDLSRLGAWTQEEASRIANHYTFDNPPKPIHVVDEDLSV